MHRPRGHARRRAHPRPQNGPHTGGNFRGYGGESSIFLHVLRACTSPAAIWPPALPNNAPAPGPAPPLPGRSPLSRSFPRPPAPRASAPRSRPSLPCPRILQRTLCPPWPRSRPTADGMFQARPPSAFQSTLHLAQSVPNFLRHRGAGGFSTCEVEILRDAIQGWGFSWYGSRPDLTAPRDLCSVSTFYFISLVYTLVLHCSVCFSIFKFANDMKTSLQGI